MVNRVGRLAPAYAFGGIEKQGERLTKEGIDVADGHVSLDMCLWHPNAKITDFFNTLE